ncbi:MAG TPA: ribose-phosphate pyrophosphokinase, partial [Dermatophilaceae bacterium]|nr:ribose-phosphate pyrophosphokinase [Dermatophilaceae bacterium]
GKAVERLRDHPMITEVVTTDTVPPPRDWPELCTLSVSALFAEAISRIHAGKSISKLFAGVDPTHAPPPQPKLPFDDLPDDLGLGVPGLFANTFAP